MRIDSHVSRVVEGKVRGTGLVYFVPKNTKFWTLKDSFVETRALMCIRCGSVSRFGDTAKLATLRVQPPQKDGDNNTADSKQK